MLQLLSSIEEKLAAYWVAGDPSFHEQILADDWRVIDGTGRIQNKAEALATSFSGDRQVSLGKIDEINVRPFGNWAIVTGRTHIVGRFGGEDMEITLRFTDVFSYRDGDWKVEASQATLLSPPEELD
jgi:ketosteroid isomerase-like protein